MTNINSKVNSFVNLNHIAKPQKIETGEVASNGGSLDINPNVLNPEGTTVVRTIVYDWDGEKWVPNDGKSSNDGHNKHVFGDEILDFDKLERQIGTDMPYSCTEDELNALLDRNTGKFN